MDYAKVQHNQNITLLLRGRDSLLRTQFFPPLVLNPNYSYSLGLHYFAVYNSVFNITPKNNRFRFIPTIGHTTVSLKKFFEEFEKEKPDLELVKTCPIGVEFEIPPGGYELSQITSYITHTLQTYDHSFDIEFSMNESTQKLSIKIKNENFYIDCTGENSVTRCLGFSETDFFHTSKEASKMINLSGFNTINIHANIISGSFLNGVRTHILHSFTPETHFGYKIVEVPHTIIYHPINTYEITDLEIIIKDEHNQILDFNKEEICLSLILKRDGV